MPAAGGNRAECSVLVLFGGRPALAPRTGSAVVEPAAPVARSLLHYVPPPCHGDSTSPPSTAIARFATNSVAVWTDPDTELGLLHPWPSVDAYTSRLDGGGVALTLPAEEASAVIGDPRVGTLLEGRIAGIRSRR